MKEIRLAPPKDFGKLIQCFIGSSGRMIGFSKSRYGEAHPNNTVYFNACIFDEYAKQVWYGDIDLTADDESLKELSKNYEGVFYVTPEHPFRSDFNDVTIKQLEKDESVIKFENTGVKN